jgi:hypothetical protein
MLTPGIPGHVLTDLRRIVESEELGESFFRAAANRAREEGHAEAWHALHRLEVQTNCGVRLFIEHTGTQLATTHRLAEAAGTLGGAALNHLPWRMQLDSVRLATRRYLPAFQRLAAAFERSDHQPFFDYAVNHELAIISFTGRALSSQRAPLDDVHRLLDTPMPLPDGY